MSMARRKYHIAMTGTFDVENYGDLLFPVVFEKAMRQRGLEFELFLFSPSGLAKMALDESVVLYSCDDFERLHAKYHFDALVVGGGAIIHFNDITIKLPGSNTFTKYHNIDSWYTLVVLAAKNGVKVLFNVPQVPFLFTKSLTPLARDAFLAADYLSVRDDFSRDYIKRVLRKGDGLKVDVFPDSVCSIAQYYNKSDLTRRARKLIGFRGKYVVVHFSRVMPEEAELGLVTVIRKLTGAGYRVVLLPLGYTHGDDSAMQSFDKKYSDLGCYVFNKKLTVDDMTSVLAGADIYIGTSFHGSIVSIAFGNIAVSFNYYTPTLKNIDNYARFGLRNFLSNDFTELEPIVDEILRGDVIYAPKLEKNVDLVNKHFDNLFSSILEGGCRSAGRYQSMRESLLSVVSSLAERDTRDVRIANELVVLSGDNMDMNGKIRRLQEECGSLVERSEQFEQSYEAVLESTSWRITKPMRRLGAAFRRLVAGKKR